MCYSRRFTAHLLTACLLLLALCTPHVRGAITASVTEDGPLVIIDPGHGGTDAGAIGASGSLEKDLNLAIAFELAECFREAGIPVLLTREADTLVLKEGEDVKGKRKQRDLYNRAELANRYPNATLISIHMNAYPVAKYRGLQVYYSPNDDASALLAEKIQSSVCDQLQPTNDREIKKANSSIFILDRIKRPAVLIECGFISNPEECALLCSEEYRQKLTLAIFCGICEYFSGDNS